MSVAPPAADGPAVVEPPAGAAAGAGIGELTAMQACARPCRSCPWRRDNAARYRYPNLTAYAEGTVPRQPGFGQADDADPYAQLGMLFACHAVTGGQHLCAGHLAVVGAAHPLVRLGIFMGLIDPAALESGDDWPPLWDSYAEMIAALDQGFPAPTGTQLVVHDEV
ncbi:DUF6283 family protein [Micromonospora chokoriensis]